MIFDRDFFLLSFFVLCSGTPPVDFRLLLCDLFMVDGVPLACAAAFEVALDTDGVSNPVSAGMVSAGWMTVSGASTGTSTTPLAVESVHGASLVSARNKQESRIADVSYTFGLVCSIQSAFGILRL